MLLHQNLNNRDYEELISGQGNQKDAELPDDSYIGADWSQYQKGMYFRFVVERMRRRGINVHLGGRTKDQSHVPAAELTIENDIRLDGKAIGYSLSFLSMLSLYGHRVQIERAKQEPKSPESILYRTDRQCAKDLLPDGSTETDAGYREDAGRIDADYAADMLAVEREAFAYGAGLLKHAPKLDMRLQYAANTFIAATSLSKVSSETSEDLRERFSRIHSRFEQNLGAMLPGFAPIKPKGNPFRKFDWAPYGAVIHNG